MTFQDLIKAITEHGLAVVLSALFLIGAWKAMSIAFKYVEGKVEREVHDKGLDTRAKISEQVQSLIDTFLVEHKGNRVQVFEFSNTVMSVAFLPFKYMTCTYEAFKLGLLSMGHNFDHLSTSLFTSFFTAISEKPYVILNIDGPDAAFVCGAMRDAICEQGETKSLCSMLYTLRGKAIGYVSLKKDNFDDADIEGIQTLAHKISTLLGVLDK